MYAALALVLLRLPVPIPSLPSLLPLRFLRDVSAGEVGVTSKTRTLFVPSAVRRFTSTQAAVPPPTKM
jgi:hypothetical protein